MASAKYGTILKKTWPLLLFNIAVAQFVSAEFINLLTISKMIWPLDLEFHALEMGAMVSTRLWVDGFSALVWGYFADRVSRKKLISGSSIFTGFFIFINGFMPVGGGFNSYIIWLVNHAIIGLCMAGGNPNISSFVSDLLDKDEKSQFFGLASIVWRVSGVVATIVGVIFFQIGLWRLYYWYCGIPFFFLFFWFTFKFKEPKRGVQEKALKGLLKNSKIKYEYQLSKETLRSTVFSKTNVLILLEGIFSGIFFGVLDLVLLPYIQSPPRNISPVNSSIFMFAFGIPGAFIGTFIFSKISDKYGSRNLKNRVT
ncbi:MAG: MFS transporter, partial [archaeon]|nr:MFS transporter [archaeon]